MIKKEASHSQKNSGPSLKDVLENTVYNKNFKNIIILTVLGDVARYFTLGFMGVFKTNSLMMSMLLVQTINVVANIMRLLVSSLVSTKSRKIPLTFVMFSNCLLDNILNPP